MADERLDERGRSRLLGLLDSGDPDGEVRTGWHAKEVVRSIYDHHDPDLAIQSSSASAVVPKTSPARSRSAP